MKKPLVPFPSSRQGLLFGNQEAGCWSGLTAFWGVGCLGSFVWALRTGLPKAWLSVKVLLGLGALGLYLQFLLRLFFWATERFERTLGKGGQQACEGVLEGLVLLTYGVILGAVFSGRPWLKQAAGVCMGAWVAFTILLLLLRFATGLRDFWKPPKGEL